jgi:hypothetical protein
VIVDAKTEAAHRFYERESFVPLPDTARRLFLPMSEVTALFSRANVDRFLCWPYILNRVATSR